MLWSNQSEGASFLSELGIRDSPSCFVAGAKSKRGMRHSNRCDFPRAEGIATNGMASFFLRGPSLLFFPNAVCCPLAASLCAQCVRSNHDHMVNFRLGIHGDREIPSSELGAHQFHLILREWFLSLAI